MSVLDQKHAIVREIDALFRDVVTNYEVPEEVTLQSLLQLKDRLTQILNNALQLRKRANDFNATQTNERYKIEIGADSTLGRSLNNIKVKFIMIRDIFSKQLEKQPQHPQASKMQEFLNSRIVTKFVGNATLAARPRPPSAQVGSPVRHSRRQSVADFEVNHESPLGCFGRMCRSIKSKFSRNRGGKRKLRGRTRRTRRSRSLGRRSRLN